MVEFYADSEDNQMDNVIQIKSKLYDYEVEFVSDFQQALQSIKGNLIYVIDNNEKKEYNYMEKKTTGG